MFERVIDDDFILTEKACTIFMRQICEGVEFIHRKNILHLDLKVKLLRYNLVLPENSHGFEMVCATLDIKNELYISFTTTSLVLI